MRCLSSQRAFWALVLEHWLAMVQTVIRCELQKGSPRSVWAGDKELLFIQVERAPGLICTSHTLEGGGKASVREDHHAHILVIGTIGN